MRSFILLSLLAMVLFSCNSESQEAKDKQQDKSKDRAERVSKPQTPTLYVYNMGGVPAKDVDELVAALKKVYPDTKYAGTLSLVDSAYIKNDPRGNNRYWWSKLLPHLKKTTDTKHGLTLVIVNAEVCNWDAKAKGSHANLGMSNCGGHVSTISYQRLKVNHLNNVNDMMKVAIHELGHSVGGLVPNRKDDGGHCPDKNCLMKNANNGFPYQGLTSFCPSCSKAMKAKGFNLEALQLKK
jgi:predicted Zn-dependent protease